MIKNWLPFVSGPAFAIDKIPAPVCFNSGLISSSNFLLKHINASKNSITKHLITKTQELQNSTQALNHVKSAKEPHDEIRRIHFVNLKPLTEKRNNTYP